MCVSLVITGADSNRVRSPALIGPHGAREPHPTPPLSGNCRWTGRTTDHRPVAWPQLVNNDGYMDKVGRGKDIRSWWMVLCSGTAVVFIATWVLTSNS